MLEERSRLNDDDQRHDDGQIHQGDSESVVDIPPAFIFVLFVLFSVYYFMYNLSNPPVHSTLILLFYC